jgi:geranylgeranyl reductase family protein
MSLTHHVPVNSAPSDFDCDIIVVGVGPAGAAAAYYLASAGLAVTVLDQARFPRPKVCGDFLSPRTLLELEKLGVTLTGANTITYATVFLSGKELAAGPFPEVDKLPRYAKVVSRRVLDDAILGAARKAGAKVLEGIHATGYAADAEGVTVTANDGKTAGSFRARLLIGADGNSSVVAHQLRGDKVKSAAGLVARGYFKGVTGNPSEANVFYGNDSFPGYSWIFPTAKGEANVGVGVVLGTSPPAENPQDLLLKLVQSDEGMRRRLAAAKLRGEVEVCALKLPDAQLSLVSDRVMVVGEAAGLVNPYNGEGVQMALLSGRWAAEAAIEAQGDYSAQALASYRQRIDDEYGFGFRAAELMLGILCNRNLNHAWLRWMELMGEKSRTDPEFARLTGGILSGMIFPNRQETLQTLMGTLQEAALSAGATAVTDLLTEPLKLPQSALNVAQSSVAAAQLVARDPVGTFVWGLDVASNLAGTFLVAAKDVLKDVQAQSEKGQQ